MPCCLLAKHSQDNAAPHPEPLDNERAHDPGHALLAVVFTLLSAFDFLPPTWEIDARSQPGTFRPVSVRATRAAVSCIWLI